MTLNVEDYGVLPSNTPAANDAGMVAAFAAQPYGRYLFPRPANYVFNQPFPARTYTVFEGQGMGTRLHMNGGLFKPAPGSPIASGVKITDLSIDNGNGTNHLIDLSGGTDMINVHVVDSSLLVDGAGKSIVSALANSVNLFGWRFNRSLLDRDGVAGVPAFNLQSNSVGLNDWMFDECQWHSHLSAGPFFFAAYTGAAHGMSNFGFNNILSEQAKDGAVNLQGVQGATIRNLCDFDVTTYTMSLVRIAAGAGGVPSNRCFVDQTGCASRNAVFPAGRDVVQITGGTGHAVARLYRGETAGGALIS